MEDKARKDKTINKKIKKDSQKVYYLMSKKRNFDDQLNCLFCFITFYLE